MKRRMRWEDVDDIDAFEFCEWVADWACDDDFEENASEFAELACRKLFGMGFVDKVGEDWERSQGGIQRYETN